MSYSPVPIVTSTPPNTPANGPTPATSPTPGTHQKFIPKTMKVKPSPAQTVAELEETMTNMDKVNGTAFKSWIKSEDNIGYVCTFKREIFEQNWETNPTIVFNVLQWLSSDWKVPSVAEFLLKMFYHWKMESVKFGALVNGLVNGLELSLGGINSSEPWADKRTYDLLHVLLIGESAKSTASFLRNFTTSFAIVPGFTGDEASITSPLSSSGPKTKQWNRFEILDLVKSLAFRLQWDETFMRTLLNEYTALAISEPRRVEELQAEIKAKFIYQKPVHAAEYLPPNSSPTDAPPVVPSKYQSFKEQVEFSINVLDMILLEAECMELGDILRGLKLLKREGWSSGRLDERLESVLKMPRTDSKADDIDTLLEE